jgi:hypothetical protein
MRIFYKAAEMNLRKQSFCQKIFEEELEKRSDYF